MGTQELLEQALKLAPNERFALADQALHSLDQPDPAIDRLWLDEAAIKGSVPFYCAYQ